MSQELRRIDYCNRPTITQRIFNLVNQIISLNGLRIHILCYWIICLYTLASKDRQENIRILQLITGIIALGTATLALACRISYCLYPLLIESLLRFFYFLFIFCYFCASITLNNSQGYNQKAQYQWIWFANDISLHDDPPVKQYLRLFLYCSLIIYYEIVAITAFCCIPMLRVRQTESHNAISSIHYIFNDPQPIVEQNPDSPPKYAKAVKKLTPPPRYKDVFRSCDEF